MTSDLLREKFVFTCSRISPGVSGSCCFSHKAASEAARF